MSEDISNRLKISRTDGGFFINSNGRELFFSTIMYESLETMMFNLRISGAQSLQNYVEPVRTPLHENKKLTPTSKLEDLI